ncbi:unnamed protein product [Phytomonas sp. EM1]|nr:unnamed protein product [Phytomonas sp. EM1]|eukprot:CCW62441.1 unnamed protein product [Phytomonas sp. isolate EM1]
MYPNTSTRLLVTNFSTLCADFDEIFAVKCLKESVAERIQHCITQSGGRAANLCKQSSLPGLQTRLLEEWLSKEDWKGLKSSFREVFFASHKSSAVPSHDNSPTDNLEMGEVNVLSFGEDITMEIADEEVSSCFPTHLRALKVLEDVLKDASRKNSASNYDEALPTTKDSSLLSGSDPVRRWGNMRKYDSATLLSSVSILMDQCPEVVLQLNKWPRFIRVLIAAAQDSPKEGLKVTLHYFRLTGARQRGALLLQLLSDISRNVQRPKEQLKASSRLNFFLSCILSCIEELPENWLGLLDDEVGELFSLFLNNAALPHMEYFFHMDSGALWVRNWSRRPTFERLVRHQLLSPRGCHAALALLQGSFPNQYALSLVAYFLPILLPSSYGVDGRTLRTTEHENCFEDLSALLNAFIRSIIEVPFSPASVQLLYKFAVSSCAHSLSLTELWDYIQSIVSIIQSLLSDDKVNRRGSTENRVCWLLSLVECFLHSVGDVKLCADVARKHLVRLIGGMKRIDSHTVSAAVGSFWHSVLDRYWRYVVDHVLSALSINQNVVCFPVFTIGHLVSISRDLDGWLQIREYFTQHADAVSCVDGGVLLRHILGLSSAEGEAKLPLQLDASIFALLSRWSTHSTTQQELLNAARRCCENYFGSPRNEDPLSFFFLPPGGLEVPSGFQYKGSPLEKSICKSSECLLAFFHLRVFLFLNLISLDWKNTTHEQCSDTTDLTLPFFVDTCLNAFLVSFTTSNNTVYTDDTRLYLLCLVSLALIFSSQSEEALWHGGSPAFQGMSQLCDVFQQRTGVDPLFLVGRFLAFGKGRKLLLSIFLYGFKADLSTDTMHHFHSFGDRGALPSQSRHLHQVAVGADYARLIIEKAFPQEASGILEKGTLVEFISLWVQACGAVDKMPSPDHVALLLSKRSFTEWLRFVDKQERAACVARAVMAYDSCKTYRFLKSAGVDLLHLSTLCVTHWMGSSRSINKSKSRNRFKYSVKLFVDNGVQHWDDFVATCLITHIGSVTQEGTDLAQRKWEIPYSSLIPLPSLFFAELLIRPFTSPH